MCAVTAAQATRIDFLKGSSHADIFLNFLADFTSRNGLSKRLDGRNVQQSHKQAKDIDFTRTGVLLAQQLLRD
jgi:hypothetical protein